MPIRAFAVVAAVAAGIVVLSTVFGDALPIWTLAVSIPLWMAAVVIAVRSDHRERVAVVDDLGLTPTEPVRPAPDVLAAWELVPVRDGAEALAAPGDPPILVLHGRARHDMWNDLEASTVHDDALIVLTAGVDARWRIRGSARDLGRNGSLPDGAGAITDGLGSAGLGAEVVVGSGWLAVAVPWPMFEDRELMRLVDTTRTIIDEVSVVRRPLSP
jgi:hypothetical protein